MPIRKRIPLGLPKTGQTTVYATGDNGTYQSGQSFPSTRFVALGNGMTYDAHTDLTWCQAPKLMIPGGTGVLVTGCVRGSWVLVYTVDNWTAGASTVLDMTLGGVTGLLEGGELYVSITTTESGVLDLGRCTITDITGTNVTVALDTSAYSGDTFESGIAGNYYQAGELVQSPTDSAFYVATATHLATTDPGAETTDGWILQEFIASASAPFTIAQAASSWSDAIAAINTVNAAGGWNGHADWRMPNNNEILSLIDASRSIAPPIYASSSISVAAGSYWTNTTRAGSTTQAYKTRMDVDYGYLATDAKTTATIYTMICRTGIA